MKYKYQEVRRITREALHKLCISEQWYNRNDNLDYYHMLDELAGGKQNITTDDIVAIVLDIIEHSDNLDSDDFESVAFKVANIATVHITRRMTEFTHEDNAELESACINIFRRVHPRADVRTAEEKLIICNAMRKYLPHNTPIHDIKRGELFSAERYARNEIIIALKRHDNRKNWPW